MFRREKRVLLRHYLDQGVPKAEIARRVGVSRRTVYHWIETGQLDRELDAEPVRYGPRRRAPSKLDPYNAVIDNRLATPRRRHQAYQLQRLAKAIRRHAAGILAWFRSPTSPVANWTSSFPLETARRLNYQSLIHPARR